MTPNFVDQIKDLIQANGWEGQVVVEQINPSSPAVVRVTLSDHHPSAPAELINEYLEGVNSLEQIQSECLRSLRTGRPGI